MRKWVVFAAFLLSTCGVLGGNGVGQESKKPFTEQEILGLLNPTPGTGYEQSGLAGEIAQRGVAFQADEKTLDGLRKAGAGSFVIDAIRKAAQNAASKQTQPQPQTPEQPQSQNRPAAEAPTSGVRPHLQRQSSPDDPATTAEDATRDAPKIDVTKLPLLDQARYHAAEFMNDLPNFVVTQIVTRSVRTPGKKDWRRQDKLEIELTYRAKTGEQFKLARYNDKPTQMTYDQLKGATSTGEFGSILGALFSPQSQAEFKEVRREIFHGRQTVIYDFKVKKMFSSNTITDVNSGRAVTTGYSGSIWIDTERGRVLRIKQAVEDIEPGFPITLAERAVEYDWISFDGQRHLLPVYAEVILGNDLKRYYLRNVIELRNYRRFDTDLKILLEK
jgi:hypothetical protein